jgi:hypothetical protein
MIGEHEMKMKSPLRALLACAVLSCGAAVAWAADAVLPEGVAPPALSAGYFPDRVHEFVWRNWSVVEPAKMAKVIGASVQDVAAMAESMGLPAAAPIPAEQKSRGYITILRRNWHLLPYSQLLEMVEMTPEQLAFSLREDDFLYHKLGGLKPKCDPLRYAAPDDAAKRRAAQIRQVVQSDLGDMLKKPEEPRFEFLKRFFAKPAVEGTAKGLDPNAPIRYIYSYFAVYGDPLANPELDSYPEGLLQQLSALGINGVWMHVVLRDLAPGGKDFPEFGAGHEKRLATLRMLVNRAKKYGVGIYLYMNEPRAMPLAFFKDRPELAGVREGDFTALCTSQPAVKRWLSDSLAYIFREVPDLAGVFTITASENLTNCASHYQSASCPHCKGRKGSEIIAEVNATIEEGVHRSNPKATVIAWDWGWRDDGEAADIIPRLPKKVNLMSVSEWSLPIERGGIKTAVGEYSLSAVGPGPRATKHWKLAQENGLKTFAKMQLNNTWEFSTIPYLPVMDLVARHCHNLASVGVDGNMLSWSLGGYPSPNLEIASRFCGKPVPSIDEVLNGVAEKRYGKEGASLARKAWSAFSTAFEQFPYSCGLYENPMQMGPANPLYRDPTGYRATMVGIPYDCLHAWQGVYPPAVFASQLEKVAAGWRAGLPSLEAAVAKAPAERKSEVEAELRFARVAANHFQSSANQSRFVMARDQLAAAKTDDERKPLRAELRRLVQSELDLAKQEFALVREDSRIGFEASNQYVFVPLDVAEKVVNCRWLLDAYAD